MQHGDAVAADQIGDITDVAEAPILAGVGTISRAPSDNVTKMSSNDASKLTDDDCSNRSSAVMLHSAMKPSTCSAIA